MGGNKRRFEQCDELRQISFATQSLQVTGAQSASEPPACRTVAEQCWRSICVVLLIVERPTRTSLSQVRTLPFSKMFPPLPGGRTSCRLPRSLPEPPLPSPCPS